jgi:hypothetical protein
MCFILSAHAFGDTSSAFQSPVESPTLGKPAAYFLALSLGYDVLELW